MTFNERFTTRAGAYAASRPSYPAASIEEIFRGLGAPAALVVADLGAGTGISSRLIADYGPRVIAVEPNAAMRAAARPGGRITWLATVAERTTLPADSVDVVTAFQAWHWFDRAAVSAEARRIARPGGKLAVVYNERDERDPFTAGFGDGVRRYATDATELWRAQALAHALGIEPARTTRAEFAQRQVLDRAGLHARTRGSSYLPQSGRAAAALRCELDALFDRFVSRDRVELHLVTVVVCVEL